jgi:molecular chaperone GrpE (heat shock protein)
VQEETTPCLGGDFLEFIALLWEIEEFNLWNPHEHGSLAYLMDRWRLTDAYQEKVDKLRTLIHSKNASEIALYISCEIVSAAHEDDAISEADRARLDANLVIQQKNYEDGELARFGIIQKKYMPNWFFEIFSGYVTLEEARRETLILQHCKAEQMTQEEAKEAYKKLATQWDILNEFYFYVKNKRFKTFHPRTVEGIPAKHLYETICDTPLSAYLYLVYLREDPEKALAEYEEKMAAFNNKNKDKVEDQISMEENKQVEVDNKGNEQGIPTPSDDNAVLEKLEALQQAMQGLQKCFDAKIAQDANQKSLADKVHQELTRYQDGALDKIIDTIALDIIQIIDTTKSNARIYEKKEPTEENYKKLLKILKNITESLDDILCRHGIESYRIPGHEVDTQRQTIIKTVPTEEQSKDGLVAARVADGYVRNNVIIRPEKIRTFKYEAPADTPANN